ncbi:M13 family metallopeptidase [Pelomonas sp. KK5]|uniref:M13 family metallopeptidase n=1 Tax=Pelomonas sp. KK5 TaxID=1855730 RepID=UPI00097CAB99|nr:M13 family metallopeptidase [Pelomonas sp. KK5]
MNFTRTLLALAAATALHGVAQAQFKPDVDSSVSPCVDFNAYVNNRWVAANPLPSDKTRWSSFDKLGELSLNAQKTLVEAADKGAAQAKGGSIEQKIGWFYRSAMDEAAIERAGFDPIKPELAAIAALKTPQELVAFLRDSHARGQGGVFYFGAGADFKNAQKQIGFAHQSGLNLPTPEYYTKDEHKDKRAAYLAHVARLFELTGVAPEAAKAKAANVLAFETRLAASSLMPVELRVPENQYHLLSIEEANKVTPHFDWAAYFKAIGVDVGGSFSLSQPKFFANFDAMLTDTPVEQWRDYLALQAIDNAAPNLSKAFQEQSFAFYDKTLKGQPEMAVRWKRALGAVNGGMGQALGQLYVKDYFPPEAKARAQVLVDNVRAALKERIEKLEWMTPETKARALEKWSTFLPKIGYPDKWREWDGLTVKADDYYANVRAARLFNARYNLAKIGKATDRYEWSMTPQTVNAYYSPSTNTINFPAAILQPPFFYAKGDDALNYGGIGAVIGHEALHGFDDKGSQFDGQGNNRNWWTKDDRERFEARAQRLIDQAGAYAPLKNFPDKTANGKLTLGENIADLGGLNVSFDALQKADGGKADPKIDGYTREQRFFLSFATVWASSIREQAQLVRLNTDPHAPSGFRASASPSNMPAFAKAFSCKAGDPMVRAEDVRVQIW